MIKLCECGLCNLEVKPNNRFIKGHNRKKYLVSKNESLSQRREKLKNLGSLEIKEGIKLCACGCNETVKLGNKYINHHSNRGIILSKRSKVITPRICVCGCNETFISKRRETQYKRGHSNRGLKHTPEQIEKTRQSNIGRKHPPRAEEFKERMSKTTKRAWAEDRLKVSGLRYSSYEVSAAHYLEPLGFIATYKDQRRVVCTDRTRVPDFINYDTMQIVELFGVWWHRDRPLPKGKSHETHGYIIKRYKEVGYACRVIWIEEEFDDFIKELNK
jgi:hypothetical protein